MRVKEEDIYVASVKKALVADGWKPPVSSLEKSVPQNSPMYKGKKNPLGEDGKPRTCFKCQSVYHFQDKCDEKNPKSLKKEGAALSSVLSNVRGTELSMTCVVFEDEGELDEDKEEELDEETGKEQDEVVFVTSAENELCLLIEEAGIRGVLDSGCSKSVAGVDWVQSYAESVSPSYADSLKVFPSKKV